MPDQIASSVWLIGIVLAALFSVVGNIVIREWYKPDVRYEVGSFYRAGASAVIAVKLRNYGRRDATSAALTVVLPDEIGDVSVGDQSVQMEVLDGGKSFNHATVRLSRIVPTQTIDVFFSIKDRGGPITSGDETFVKSVFYDGGRGKTGLPLRLRLLPLWGLLASVVLSAAVAVLIGLAVLRLHPGIQRIEREQQLMSSGVLSALDAQDRIVTVTDSLQMMLSAVVPALDALERVVTVTDSMQSRGEAVPDPIIKALLDYHSRRSDGHVQDN